MRLFPDLPSAPTGILALEDELVARYEDWREACQHVRLAYEDWRSAERPDRSGAFFAYRAALDREESAARDYREIVERLAPCVGASAPS